MGGKISIIPVVGKKAFPFLDRSTDDDYTYPMIVNPDFAEKMNVFKKLQQHNIDITGSILPNAFEMKKTSLNNYIIGVSMVLMQLS